jgi:hypothetical protein
MDDTNIQGGDRVDQPDGQVPKTMRVSSISTGLGSVVILDCRPPLSTRPPAIPNGGWAVIRRSRWCGLHFFYSPSANPKTLPHDALEKIQRIDYIALETPKIAIREMNQPVSRHQMRPQPTSI